MVVARGWVEEGIESSLMGTVFNFYKMKSSRDWLHNNVNYFILLNYTFKWSIWSVLCFVNFIAIKNKNKVNSIYYSWFSVCHFLLALLVISDCDLMNCSRPGSSIRGILQARILE